MNPAETLPIAPLQIGRLKLEHPFVQAALSGYSDWAMRRLARRYGAAYTIAEVMIDRFANEVKGTARTARYFRVDPEDHPVGAQLMGSEPSLFVPAAKRLVAAGFDVIDINFGCPVKSALGGCRGGYHLSQPAVALDIVERVRSAVPAEIPVTLKMRRGIDDTLASRERFFEILRGAIGLGVSAVTVHGRTVEQKYRGPSNWEFLCEVKQSVGEFPILGSGDLFTAEDSVRMIQETGVNGVTIARGAIGSPWIFRQAINLWRDGIPPQPPSLTEQRRALEQHYAFACEYDAPSALRQLRKFAFRYSEAHPQHEQVRDAIHAVRTEDDWTAFLERFYPGEQRVEG